MTYKEIKVEEINFNNNNILLIVTATDLETKCLHDKLDYYENHNSLLKINNGNSTYFLGVFGKYLAIHVQCGNMGSISRDSSIITTNKAINLFSPKITLMIGIAFGIDNSEQNIGDVLVSRCITPYNSKKIQNGKDIKRSDDAPASSLLINKFQNTQSWEFFLNDSTKAKKIIAPILSGEELINDLERRNELLLEKPSAKGGEMEGAGVYAAAEQGKIDWIIVKGICDFADGNKDKDKDSNQIIAMESAISLCLEVFSSINSFEGIQLFPVKVKVNNVNQIEPKILYKVLFDRYDNFNKEQYYQIRDIDTITTNNLKIYSIWLYGKSGRGKTNFALRNLINEKLNFIQISLGNCVGLTVDEFFKEIYLELLLKLEPEKIYLGNVNFKQSIKDIIVLLEKHYSNKTLYIVIDEIPLGEGNYCKDFTDKICSLFISNSLNNQTTQIKYILCSIFSPLNLISEFNEKIHEHVKFIELKDWNEIELENLVNLIENGLSISNEKTIKDGIINAAKGSPRFIKKTYKNAFTFGGFNNENLNKSLIETNRELNKK